MTEEQDFNFEDIKVTKDVLDKAAEKTIIAEGIAMSMCVEAKSKVSERTGSVMSELLLAPLKDPTDPDSKTSPLLRHHIVYPFQNPKWADEDGNPHSAPDTSGMTIQAMRAIFGKEEIPYFPRKNPETKVWEYNGEEISDEDRKTVTAELTAKALKLARECLIDPDKLVSDTRGIITQIKHETYMGELQSRVDRLHAELPQDKQFLTGSGMRLKVSRA